MCGFSKSTWIVILAICAALWIQIMKRNKLCNSKTDLTGKTVIVTGGNSGVGYETALDIARRNAKLIIACRNEQKAKKAVVDIEKTTGSKSVKYLIVDFAEMANIRRAAEEFMQKEDRLDILINNAAVFGGGKTKDGFDAMFGVNHLGYFMLTNLLMPLMRKTAKTSPVRIINVSSGSYEAGIIDFGNLNPEISLNDSMGVVMGQYANTKLMNLYFTSELDARLKKEFEGQKQTITTYSLHPGMIYSNIGKEYFGSTSVSIKIIWGAIRILFTQPAPHGAQTSVCCAVQEGIEQYSGQYFDNLEPVEVAECARNPKIGTKLWTVSEQLTGLQWGN